MNRSVRHFLLVIYLITFTWMVPGGIMQALAQEVSGEDSIRAVELMVKDTIDLEFHGPSSDITFYMNGMVFLSNSKYHQKMIPDHITFGVVKSYFVPLDYIAFESSTPLFSNDNFPYSPAGMSFSRDYHNVYFTKSEESHGRPKVEKIYEMAIVDGEASSQNPLSFTSDQSRYLHPAISTDESYMIFSSDRSPSSGGLDLFISKKTSDGWSAPENMGQSVNTSSHEWYPYLDHNNNLYFSSAGHMGYGGYDVFVCYFNGSSWDQPRNLTNFINSELDEIGFSTHPNKQFAVLSQVHEGESKGEVFQITLSEKALLVPGENNSHSKDISVLLRDLIESGYTAGNFSSSEVQEGRNRQLSSTPLIGYEEEVKTEPDPVVQDVSSMMAEAETKAEPAEEIESRSEPDPNRLLFRVQILSSTRANTSPEVTVEGKSYNTFEYYYKGAYRITVGAFEELDNANAFRLKCKNSGFNQAWVAAFRGEERETDPSVFKKK